MKTFLLCILTGLCITYYPHSQTITDREKERQLDSIMTSHLIHDGKHAVHNFMLYIKTLF